jgi:hypothetical protein
VDERDDRYTATRTSLHALAEHVLSTARYQATGRIGLRRTPGGFGTPPFESTHGARRLRVDGAELVAEDDRGERRSAITTLRSAGAFAEIEPGAPADVYTPATPLDLDVVLVVDADAARRLADWYALTDQALERLRTECADEDPAPVQLWPEHFDLATTIAEVNYGGSPGDDAHPSPYLYVGPFRPPAPDGEFWNERFGASVPASAIGSADDALAFFRAGRQRLRALTD